MILIIPPDKQRLGLAGVAVDFRLMPTPLPPAAGRLIGRQVFQFKLQDIEHHRPFNLHGIILFGFRAVIGHMLGGVVNSADEGGNVVNHHDFTMHAAKQIGAHTEQSRARVVVAKNHASRRQLPHKAFA